MKKTIKYISIFLLTLVFGFSTFKVFTAFAEPPVFSVTKFEAIDKTEKTIVNEANLTSGLVHNDVIFTDIGDYVKYEITIKNNTEDDYVIKSITDDNASPYLEYTYDNLTNTEVKAGEEKTFNYQIKYISLAPSIIISDQNINIKITYQKQGEQEESETIVTPDDTNKPNETNKETKIVTNNPKTYDGLITYIILGSISLIGLTIIISKKYLFRVLGITGLLTIIGLPLSVKAEEGSFVITSNPNLIRNSYSELISGIHFNYAASKLSSGNNNLGIELFGDRHRIIDNNYSSSDPEYVYYNTDITSIKKASYEEYKLIKDTLTNDNIVSTDESNVPTYIWFDNGTLYYYSIANTIYMNKDASTMYYGFKNLSSIDFTSIDTSKTQNMGNMFRDSSSLGTLDLSSFNTSNVVDMRDMINGTNISSINVSSFDTSKVIYFQGMFNSYKGESLNIDNFDTSSARYLNHMFAFNTNLKTINLSNFDTSNVESMAAMFHENNNLQSVNLSSFNTSKVTDMSYMFMGCNSLSTLDLSNFDTHNVTNMSLMFRAVSNLETLDLSNFDTSNVTDMSDMFSLTNFTNFNISSFNTSKVRDMHGMFSGARMSSLDISNFDTKRVTTFWHMFSVMPNITELDLSFFDTRSATDMRNMFSGSTALTTIYASNNFVTTNVTQSEEMFLSTYVIDGGNGTLYDENHIDKTYAHFDEGTSNPGYFHQNDKYRIIFDSKGGSAVNQKIINRGNPIGAMETPTKNGYTFEGWYLDDTKITSDYVPTKNITLTAKYKTNAGFDANIYGTWVWDGALQNILDSEEHMDYSIQVYNALGVKEVYLSIMPEDLEANHLYFEKLYDAGIKVYALYGDPVFIDEIYYPNVIDYDLQMVHDYNANHEGTSYIEGIHYDVEYYGYKYDGVNTCPDGNTEEAMRCPARKKYATFVKNAYNKAHELDLKVQFDITIWSSNFSFYYGDNDEELNLLDEIIDYNDGLVIMAYGNSPKNTIPSFIQKGDYTEYGVTKFIEKNYYEKAKEKGLTIYVGQEVEVFKNTAQELAANPELGPIYLPEYEGESGTNYKYTYNFVMSMFNDLEDLFRENDMDDIKIIVHDYIQLEELYRNR